MACGEHIIERDRTGAIEGTRNLAGGCVLECSLLVGVGASGTLKR